MLSHQSALDYHSKNASNCAGAFPAHPPPSSGIYRPQYQSAHPRLYLSVPDTDSLQTISNIRSLSGLLLGIAAGVLGLESINGFLFYLAGCSFVSLLIHFVLAGGQSEKYFAGTGDRGEDGKGNNGAWRDVWLGGGVLTEAVSGFILGWAGVGGVIR